MRGFIFVLMCSAALYGSTVPKPDLSFVSKKIFESKKLELADIQKYDHAVRSYEKLLIEHYGEFRSSFFSDDDKWNWYLTCLEGSLILHPHFNHRIAPVSYFDKSLFKNYQALKIYLGNPETDFQKLSFLIPAITYGELDEARRIYFDLQAKNPKVMVQFVRDLAYFGKGKNYEDFFQIVAEEMQ